MIEVYLRCNGGHYFRAETHCPLDGWTSDGVEVLLSALSHLSHTQQDPTIDLLRQHGVQQRVLDRTIIVEFGSEKAVFDAIEPAGYLLGDKWKPLSEAGPNFA
jgi:hypothetical protein